MNVYGLKSPKTFSRLEYPALDTNRLEGFREKYALLKDLMSQTGARASLKRNLSMTTSHWTIKDTARFNEYVKVVRTEVDALIDLMSVKEQVDRGTRSDLKSMGWHPDLTGPMVRHDWEKLRLIREACEVDYPEYIEVIDKALQYISEEIKESSLAQHRAGLGLTETHTSAAGARRKSDYDIRSAPAPATATATKPTPPAQKTHIQLAAERALNPNTGKEKRPGWLKGFKFKSWSKGSKQAAEKQRSNSVPDASTLDAQRSLSVGEAPRTSEESNQLQTVRSKSLSAVPTNDIQSTPSSLDSRVRKMSLEPDTSIPPIQENGGEVETYPEREGLGDMDKNGLVQVDTVDSEGERERLAMGRLEMVNSLIDRHDMFPAMGRIETKDIRDIAHAPGQ
jgi:predicted component of type VI protein secretion system